MYVQRTPYQIVAELLYSSSDEGARTIKVYIFFYAVIKSRTKLDLVD